MEQVLKGCTIRFIWHLKTKKELDVDSYKLYIRNPYAKKKQLSYTIKRTEDGSNTIEAIWQGNEQLCLGYHTLLLYCGETYCIASKEAVQLTRELPELHDGVLRTITDVEL